jgi:hypothetical protein
MATPVWLGAQSMLGGIATYLCMAMIFLISALARKNIFNDMWNIEFNLLFATIFGEIGFIGTLIVGHLVWHIHTIKWALGIGLIFMLVFGLLFKDLFGFGNSDNSGGETTYE